MSRSWRSRLVVIVVGVGLAALLWARQADVVSTLRPFDAPALAEATTRGEPAVLVFTADWCSACRQLDTQVLEQREVARAAESVLTMRVDVSRPGPSEAELSRRHRVQSLPTVVVLGRDGRERPELRLVGFEPPAAFVRRLVAAAH